MKKKRNHSNLIEEFTLPDILKFIAILLLMGYNSLPDIDQYWSLNPMFSNTAIKNIMSRDKFRQIKKVFVLFDIDNR